MKTCKEKSFWKYLQIQGPHLEIEKLDLTGEDKCLKSILTTDIMVKIQQLKYSCFLGPVKQ